jgi:pyruvate/2-oxoglutarate dehydrogenase complex dihydrolipoamide dehydrogenase (E3) component
VTAETHYDLIVVGGGSAGLTSVTMAARLGARALLVDRESLGGDCLHYGCVPSKSLIASARTAHTVRNAEAFGLESVEAKINFPRVMDRIDRIRDEIGSHETPDAIRKLGVDVALGGARFIDEFTLEIGDADRVTGDKILIATGSHAVAPDILGLAEAGFIDHVDLFGLREQPARLAVIGGGAIGTEMGQALSRLGSDVTIIQRAARLLPREDPEISAVLQDALVAEGVKLLLSATPVAVSRDGSEKVVAVEQDGHTHSIRCDEILVAVGRKPVVDALNVSAAGIKTNKKGIVVDDRLRTNKPHIFAVGDCNGGPQFTHWAEYEARIATRNALYRGSSKRSLRTLPWVTFTDPEVARVGLTLDEACSRDGNDGIHEHVFPYARLDRAVCEGNTNGMIKVVVDKSDRILGAHIIGLGAGEALTEWVLAMEHRIPLSKIGSAIHVYPTLSRINRRVADEAFLAHGVANLTNRLFARFRSKADK